MRADRVAVGAGIDGADHRAAFARSWRAPADRETVRARGARDAMSDGYDRLGSWT